MREINHTEYPKSLRNKSDDSLRYTIADAQAAIACFPEGEKAGYYADEINYCAMELQSRAIARAQS
jgi:hypothetical protein